MVARQGRARAMIFQETMIAKVTIVHSDHGNQNNHSK
jgi:hypothetical protein